MDMAQFALIILNFGKGKQPKKNKKD